MKKFFLLILSTSLVSGVFGQTFPDNRFGKKDIIVNNEYEYRQKFKPFATFIVNNSVIIPKLIAVHGLDANNINSMDVKKRDTVIDGIEYYGLIYVNTYKPMNLISLRDLKKKYTDINDDTPTIFMINDDIITEYVYDKLNIDENYVLKIVIDKIETDSLNFWVLKILTKTEENIEKSKEMRIR